MSAVHGMLTWRVVAREVRRRWPALLAAVAGLLGALAVDLLTPWPLKLLVDHVLLGRPPPPALAGVAPLASLSPAAALGWLAALMALLAALGGALAYLQAFVSARIGYDVVHAVRRELFARLAALSLGSQSRFRSGEILSRIASDTVIVRDVFSDWAAKALGDALLVAGVLAVMVAMSPTLALLVALALPLLYLLMRRIGLGIRAAARAQRRQDGDLAGRLNETLAAMPLVQAFGREAHELARFEEESRASRDSGVRSARSAALVSRAVGLVAALVSALVVYVGGRMALGGELSPGDLLIFVAYVTALFKPVRDLGKLWARFSRAQVSAERLGEILALEDESRDAPGAIDAGRAVGRLELERVSFGYAPDRPVLREASLCIEPGEHVAVIGPSGAGKSSLLRLALRLCEPQAGELRLDGRPLGTLTRASLRREIGVVLQDALMVGETIAANIRWGRLDASDAEVERAARLAGVHEFASALPAGYATLVGERGAQLSGGQRQRICLARTLVRDPAVLILDEPTSAVDAASAAMIERAIAWHRRGRTTLVIGHQFASFDGFDRVLEVDRGRIVDVTARLRGAAARTPPEAALS